MCVHAGTHVPQLAQRTGLGLLFSFHHGIQGSSTDGLVCTCLLPLVFLSFSQVLNEYFHNVCELDLVFNFYKVYTVVDEMFLAGEIRETSQTKVLKQLLMLQSLE